MLTCPPVPQRGRAASGLPGGGGRRRTGSRRPAPRHFPAVWRTPRRNADCASAGSISTSRRPPRPNHGDQTKELLQTFLSQHTRLASIRALSPRYLHSTEWESRRGRGCAEGGPQSFSVAPRARGGGRFPCVSHPFPGPSRGHSKAL